MMYAEFLEYSCGLHRQWKKTHCRKRCERTEPWTMQALMFFVKSLYMFWWQWICESCFHLVRSLWQSVVPASLWNLGILLKLQHRKLWISGISPAGFAVSCSDLFWSWLGSQIWSYQSLAADRRESNARRSAHIPTPLAIEIPDLSKLSKQFKLKLVMKFHKSNQMTRPHYRNHRKKVPAFVAQEVHQLQGREVRCQRNVMQFLDALIVK